MFSLFLKLSMSQYCHIIVSHSPVPHCKQLLVELMVCLVSYNCIHLHVDVDHDTLVAFIRWWCQLIFGSVYCTLHHDWWWLVHFSTHFSHCWLEGFVHCCWDYKLYFQKFALVPISFCVVWLWASMLKQFQFLYHDWYLNCVNSHFNLTSVQIWLMVSKLNFAFIWNWNSTLSPAGHMWSKHSDPHLQCKWPNFETNGNLSYPTMVTNTCISAPFHWFIFKRNLV